ncbi:putative F-box domain-containing protein [Seiridium cardinale]|uniref:F-box domain-containing protein n=1 Tax=Seiridium cardinale TaxID=138064 RepID=A0ABR2XYV6_9PEZI
MATSLPTHAPIDVFGRLPVEIRLSIMDHCHGPSSLWSLIKASRAMSSVFEGYGAEIIENNIAKTVPVQTQTVMRAVFRTRIGCGPGFDDAKNLTKVNSHPIIEDKDNEKSDIELPRRFLTLAHRIHTLAHACIDHYIEKSLTIRPASVAKFPNKIHNLRKKDGESEDCRYQPRITGPPSWVEEHRVIKALWRVQLFFELNSARTRHRLDWPVVDLDALASSSLPGYFSIDDYEIQQILTVYEYLEQLQNQQCLHDYRLPTIGKGLAIDYSCADQTVSGFREECLQHRPGHIDWSPTSCASQRVLANGGLAAPIPGIPFEPYRKYGLAIWDNVRMRDLGLSEPRRMAMFTMSKYFFRWYSILTEEERRLHPWG